MKYLLNQANLKHYLQFDDNTQIQIDEPTLDSLILDLQHVKPYEEISSPRELATELAQLCRDKAKNYGHLAISVFQYFDLVAELGKAKAPTSPSHNEEGTAVTVQKRSPVWEDRRIESFTDLIVDVGLEGVSRLFATPIIEETEKAFHWSQGAGLGIKGALELDSFHNAVEYEAIELATRLGYALALTQPGFRTFESWLQEAIEKAGLQGYRHSIKFQPGEFQLDKSGK